MINEFIKKHSKEMIKNIINIGKKYYLVNSNLLKIKDKIGKEVFSIGVYLGGIKSNKFVPSIELINMLSKNPKKQIIVNDKAEWLFLCGRDVFMKSILSGTLKMNKEYFVMNSKEENLGLGKFDGKIVKNLVDKGMYLRIEK